MKKLLLIPAILCSIVANELLAQQQATFTQYMFNGLAINPAYAGSHDLLDISALGRWQWAGVEGAPTTQTLAMHTGIPGKNIGLGLQITNDQIAVTDQTSVMLAYSYSIPLGNGALRMGAQGGFQSFRSDLLDVYTLGAGIDQSFSQNVSASRPNFGLGFYYSNSKWYGGLSSPILLNNTLQNGDDVIITQSRHYFLTGGYLFDLSPDVKVKPSFLVKAVSGAPVSVDYNVNVLLKELLWVGVSVRPPESINFLVEFNINSNFRVGYAYDYIIDDNLSNITTSSHELLINYRFQLFKNKGAEEVAVNTYF